MISKVFTDESTDSNSELAVFMNTKNRCAVVIEGNEDWEYSIVTLDSNDITELIKELKLIKKQMNTFQL